MTNYILKISSHLCSRYLLLSSEKALLVLPAAAAPRVTPLEAAESAAAGTEEAEAEVEESDSCCRYSFVIRRDLLLCAVSSLPTT